MEALATADSSQQFSFGQVGSVNGKELQGVLSKVAKAVGKDRAQCTLSHKKIVVRDLEIEISVDIASLNFQDIATVLLSDLLIVAKITKNDFSLKTTGEGTLLVHGSIVLNQIIEENLMLFYNLGEAVSEEFAFPDSFGKVILGMPNDISQSMLRGLGVSLKSKKIAVSNGHFLLCSRLDYSGEANEAHWTVPYEAIEIIKKEKNLRGQFFRLTFPEQPELKKEQQRDPDNFCLLSSDRITVITKIANIFPDFMQLLEETQPREIKFSNKEMAGVMEECVNFQKDGREKCIAGYGKLNHIEIVSKSSLGEVKRLVKMSGTHGLVIGFNAIYMTTILKTQGEEVVVRCQENHETEGFVCGPLTFVHDSVTALLMTARVF